MGGELRTITWPTTNAAPAATLGEENKALLPFIRFGVSTFPEPAVMQFTLMGGSALGLPADKAASLHSLLAERYLKIHADETFSTAPSALGYCFSSTKPETGLATLYLPESVNSKTNVILFLHGYGGSFIFYLHYLASAFPDHIIICPAYGISAADIQSAYLEECLNATSKDLDIQLKRPVLMGLSAGGFGGFREYTRRPESYLGYICLAAYPPKDATYRSPRNGRIRLVAGGDEVFVKSGELNQSERSLKRRTPNYSSILIPNQDHFFMLGAEDTTKNILKKWNAEFQTEEK